MAFHGYTAADIEYGRRVLHHYTQKIDDDATAGELVRIGESFYSCSYPGVSISEELTVIQKVSAQALAQLAAAEELGLVDDIRDYGAVVARTRQQIDIMSYNRPIHPVSDQQKDTYNTLKRLD